MIQTLIFPADTGGAALVMIDVAKPTRRSSTQLCGGSVEPQPTP